ncbi:MAG: S41 family peptidase, partial [Endomicrobiales bacterium]
MLGELGSSHTRYYTRDAPEYYQLASIFYSLPEVRKLFKGSPVAYPSIGLLTEQVEDKVFVRGVFDGGIAQKAGIMRGDEIVSADGKPFRPVRSLRDTAAGSLVLAVRRSPDMVPFRVEVTPATVEPSEEFLAAEKKSVRLIKAGGRKIGYIHVWSYAGEMYQKELAAEITGGVLKDADALVWDLRDGWGGADPAYLNVFNRKVPVLTITDREGKTVAADPQWRKPAVMLVNKNTRSGKEVLAYGFKKYGLGAVVGEKTGGEVLAGRLFVISDGSLLYLAVGEPRVDGELLEGAGVEPDIAVPADFRYSGGKDPQLEKAVECLSRE